MRFSIDLMYDTARLLERLHAVVGFGGDELIYVALRDYEDKLLDTNCRGDANRTCILRALRETPLIPGTNVCVDDVIRDRLGGRSTASVLARYPALNRWRPAAAELNKDADLGIDTTTKDKDETS